MSTLPSPPQPIFQKPTLRLFLLLLALWAAIYLPGLGALELKGEEGRRILPAITMLETGNWLVPYVGGKPFLRKPPLVNWLIAISMKVTGSRSEFAARLPTVLAMLALTTTLLALGTGRGWMNAETALVAALLVMTPAAALDKCRLAEIEGVYLALSGIAIVVWLAWWAQRRSAWLLWLVPFTVIGLGLLAKAPLHLLFFYVIVIAVLAYAREWKALLHPAHFIGLAIAGGIFACWAIPYFQDEATKHAAEVWQGQSVGRLSGKFDWGDWAMNIPSALGDQLPWILFAPLLWRPGLSALGEREWALFRGVRLGVVLCFFGLLLLPGILPRYILPLMAPFACLLAYALADDRLPPLSFSLRCWWRANSGLAIVIGVLAIAAPIALAIADNKQMLGIRADYPTQGALAGSIYISGSLLASAGALALALLVWLGRRRLARPVFLAVASAMLIGAGMFLFAGALVPFIVKHDKLRPVAKAVTETVPVKAELYVYDPDYRPALFYLRRRFFYAPNMEGIPNYPAMKGVLPPPPYWVLTREEKLAKLLRDRPDFAVVSRLPEKNPQFVLLEGRPVPSK